MYKQRGGILVEAFFFQGGETKSCYFFSVDAFQHSMFTGLNAGIFVTKHVMTSGFTRIKGSNYYTRWALLLVMNALVAPINGLKNMGHNRGLFHPYEWSQQRLQLPTLSGDLYG